jgi:multiple sugar transport system ATP-binding protein
MVYLLDEPMSNLDAQLREQIRPELRRLIFDQGKPTVYVTHDQNEALAMANKIAIINNGEILQLDTPIHLYNNPNSLFVAQFLGRPQINCLKPRDHQIQAIRPEDLKFSESGLPCRLVSREWLGNTQLLYLESAEGGLRMVVEPSFQCPERLFVTWQQSKVFRFDAKTGLRTS